MALSRRDFLGAAALGSFAAAAGGAPPAQEGGRKPLGIAISSYAIHARAGRAKDFAGPLKFLAFCHERGAAGVQVPIGVRDGAYTKAVRRWLDEHRMYLEGSLRMPRDKADVERFEAEVCTAREAGATVVRTVMLPGRRYEVFKDAKEYRAFKERSRQSLRLAEPVVARHKVRLAVENHKDFRVAELVELLRQVGSEWVGACVDLGNNVALLEGPAEVIRALAPLAFACHFKDMAVADAPDGFLLAEVPLGEGFLDLKGAVSALRKARPEVRLSLEMITRDPLRVPCLSDGYWATLADVPGRDLARTLALVRKHGRKTALPRVSPLAQEEQLAAEDRNVRRSLAFAREHLSL
jgi:sugar phosphate isomerase/epimerase